MADPKKLQEALDSAMADNLGGQFRSLITNLIEARSKNKSSESPNEAQSIIIFTNGARLIWETYLKCTEIVAGIAKPAGG